MDMISSKDEPNQSILAYLLYVYLFMATMYRQIIYSVYE
jgi:hypothetical protein